MSRSNSVRRARPLLGTIVEIRAEAASSGAIGAAIDAAFAAVARVERLMSIHAPDSEISRLNRTAHERIIAVDPWTWDVLAAAQRIYDESGGLFDCTIAPVLARDGFLPRESVAPGSPCASQADVLLLDGCRVRFRKPLSLDLGGIAKGYAIDRAVAALEAQGIAAGAVNAGGDLRVFGPSSEPIHLRHPGDPGRLLHVGWLSDGAIASSASYYARRQARGRWLSPIVDPRARVARAADDASVSVIAPDALTADALTKPVTLMGAEAAADLLARFGARAVVVAGDGDIREAAHAA